jgi:hypothetical protein
MARAVERLVDHREVDPRRGREGLLRRTYYSDQGRPVETADIVVHAAHCEIVNEIPVNRWPTRATATASTPWHADTGSTSPTE